MDRIEQLRRAEELLNEASRLMDGALRMSGMESRSGNDSETIRRIASDPDYAGSLRNIILDMEYLEKEQPLWTQPLVSPKRQFDRDGGDRCQTADDGRFMTDDGNRVPKGHQ